MTGPDAYMVTWLHARLDEDEQAARDVDISAAGGVHTADCTNDVRYPEHCYCGWPTRLLGEVEAKRRILNRHQPIEIFGSLLCTHCGVIGGQGARKVAAWPCPELRDLAAPYADWPGYRDDWKPLNDGGSP